jgi:Galactosyltransferase
VTANSAASESAAGLAEDLRLALASQFFDAGWYLARYPDVAAAGLDPLTHFLRFGIAEGRDPGPLFDAKWYLANNPDVAAAGTIALVHYFQSGAAEGREPNPSSILRKKIKRLGVGQVDLSIPGETGAKAKDDNTIELRTTWRRHFLARGIDAYRRGEQGASLRSLMSAVQVCPEFNESLSLFAGVFAEYNGEALRLFERTYATSKLVVAHVSCRPKLGLAELSASSFSDPAAEVDTLRVIGDETLPEHKFHFDATRRLLVVPADDAYEGLPAKVIKTLLFIGLSCVTAPLLKLDDDVICDDVAALKAAAKNVLSKSDYGGRVLPPVTRLSDSQFWHFGKCKNPDINFRPDGMFCFFPYAAGPCYWLSAEAINLLSKVALLHDRYFETERYEDRAVGTALNYYGVRPYHHDLIAAGRVRYSDPEAQKSHLKSLGPGHPDAIDRGGRGAAMDESPG